MTLPPWTCRMCRRPEQINDPTSTAVMKHKDHPNFCTSCAEHAVGSALPWMHVLNRLEEAETFIQRIVGKIGPLP